ncbi:MAG: UDP-3-O-acylglucosamine N-acyltransferase [Pseudomonadota bacterium]|jgi:UDP-3-O-[3-hydroxymyristoyl] glucosamine N-acyltransferase
MSLSLAAVAAFLEAELIGDPLVEISGVGSLQEGQANQIGFFQDRKRRQELKDTALGAVILRPEHLSWTASNKLVCDNPHVAFARLAQRLHPRLRPEGRHPSAVIDPSSQVHASAHIAAHVVIGANCVIAEGVVIEAHAVLYDDVQIGPYSHVHAGAVIGAEGFGYANDKGQWLAVPQVGGVRIGARVDIGANTTIDRGALEHTIIEDGVKLDNQIQIGHNCVIGAHTAIAGCVGIAGSARIGRYCMIGGAAMIAGHLSICDGVIISGGTLVASDITEKGQYTGVFPTLPHRSWAKLAGSLRYQVRHLVSE